MKKLLSIICLSFVFCSCETKYEKPFELEGKEVSYDIFKQASDASVELDSTDILVIQRQDEDYLFKKVDSKKEVALLAVYNKVNDVETGMLIALIMGLIVGMFVGALFTN